jgi:hypothetical protein
MRFRTPVDHRLRRRLRPAAEGLEAKALLSGFSPTSIEQYYLEQLNDARFNPGAYGVSIGVDLSNIAPSQPLAMNTQLVEAARLHSVDMIARNYFDHYTPEGIDPGQRIAATGLVTNGWAESIESDTQSNPPGMPFDPSYAAQNASYSLSLLIVDQGVPDLGHRVQLLDIGGQLHNERQVGIGLASQDQSQGGYVTRTSDTTIDMAQTLNTDPFLTGVAFNDTNGNGEYDPGEGLGGVSITVANVGATTTLDAGGYGIQLAPGVYNVTASGGGLASPITRTVVIGTDNQRLNFDTTPNGAAISGASGSPISGVLGTFQAMQPGDTPASYSARVDWGDGHASLATLTPNGQGGFTVTASNTYAGGGAYAVRVLITHLSDGQTLALNATALVDGAPATGLGPGPGPVTVPTPGTGKVPAPGTGHVKGKGHAHAPVHHPKPKPKPHPKPHPKPIPLPHHRGH